MTAAPAGQGAAAPHTGTGAGGHGSSEPRAAWHRARAVEHILPAHPGWEHRERRGGINRDQKDPKEPLSNVSLRARQPLPRRVARGRGTCGRHGLFYPRVPGRVLQDSVTLSSARAQLQTSAHPLSPRPSLENTQLSCSPNHGSSPGPSAFPLCFNDMNILLCSIGLNMQMSVCGKALEPPSDNQTRKHGLSCSGRMLTAHRNVLQSRTSQGTRDRSCCCHRNSPWH